MSAHPLDNPIWHALSGPHDALSQSAPLARRYLPQVASLGGLSEDSEAAFEQLRGLGAPAIPVALFTAEPVRVPAGWQVLRSRPIQQMLCEILAPGRPTNAAPVELDDRDVPAMLALVAATEPGPFNAQTIRCGRYVGVRAEDGSALAAMAGERLRLADFVEISAVCTLPAYRGLGHARAIVHGLTAAAMARGQAAFLHVKTENASAIALYLALGYKHRRTMQLTVLRHAG